ncbi:MAG: glycosyltransferase family 39 protein [Armatimonadetes bacterium]|nr:glycosyltransferase family 39 protein [Armatimonadota bacterium]
MMGILLVVLLAVLAFGIGAFFLRRLPTQSLLERAAFAIALGMGVISYTILALGLLKQAKMLPLTLGVLLVGLPLAFLGYRSLPKREKTEEQSAGVLGIAVALVLGLCGLITLVGALNPPGVLEWDSLSYHLAAPKRYLQEGRIYYIPDDHHSNFPFTLNMLYLWMLSLGSVSGAKLCHWLCGALLTLAVYTCGARHFSKTIGQVAAVVTATTPMLLWESTTAYIDLALALFSFLSFYAVLNAHEQPRWLVVSAVLMGLALGTKSTALAFWAMGVLGLLAMRLPFRLALVWAGMALAIGLPWYLKTFLYTGDPVYPFGWKLFHGRYWSDAAALGYAKDQAAFGLGKDPLHLLLAPWNVTMEASVIPAGRSWVFTEYVIFGLSPVNLAIGIALPLLVKTWDKKAVACLFWGLGISATWFFMMQQTRYLVPALPVFALVCAWGLMQAGKFARIAGGTLVALAALWGTYLALTQLLPAAPLKALEAAETWINVNAPKDAKVALFDETRGFYLDRAYVWAQPNHAPGLLPYETYENTDAFLADFKRRGYTYLLINTENSPKDRSEDAQWARWRPLLQEAVESGKVETAHSLKTSRGEIIIYRIP